MTSTPVLSYKKPSQVRESSGSPMPSSISPSSPMMSPKVPGTPTLEVRNSSEGTRKVSSRRKALQEFYHIQQQRKEEDEAKEKAEEVSKTEQEPQDQVHRPRNESISGKVNVDDPNSLANYIRNTPIQEILKLRNSITNNLNSHDSEKKSIIYDNYYELIKLNQTLQNLSNPTTAPADTQDQGFTGLKGLDIPETKIDQKYIFQSLNELRDFFENKASAYNDDFQNIIGKFDIQGQGDTESISSVKGVVDEQENVLSFPESIDRNKLITDIDTLLSRQIDDTNKPKIKDQINTIIDNLDSKKDQLLILQLHTIKDNL